MEEKNVWVVGHRHPDTDSVCAAIAYADYKNQLEERNKSAKKERVRYIAKRAGEVNAETAYVLQYSC